MYGTIAGNAAATAYYLYFQLIGLTFASMVLSKEKPLPKLVIGSAAGSLLLTWLPVLFSFFFDFTLLSHVLALVLTLPVLIAALHRRLLSKSTLRLSETNSQSPGDARRFGITTGTHTLFAVILTLFMIFWIFLLYTHTILPDTDGAIYTGQCTYGDMNMHLGFITSLAIQRDFPPDYSIMPGIRLSYPFLSDSISSSLYCMGASLRTAYILPMIFAMAQIFGTVYLFAYTLFESPKQIPGSIRQMDADAFVCGNQSRAVRTALLTLLLFFCNGGLGFAYFLNWSKEQTYTFSDIFTGFYTTPTNLINENIRWVNVIADMLLPQRATLFGYAVLFPALWLLYRAAFQNCRKYFPLAGLFAAALPMIHTHSFLSAGIISAVWLFLWLYNKVYPEKQNTGISCIFRYPGTWILALFTGIMCLLQWKDRQGALTSQSLTLIGLAPFCGFAVWGIILMVRSIRINGWKELISCWGIYLACVLLPALPQLFFWTFGQVAEGGFVRGHFNWGNQGDFYPWFYIKNIGAPLLLILGSICACSRRKAPVFLPAFFLWWLGELIVFTPNTYDNNKILYVAYFFLCLGAADYGLTLFNKISTVAPSRLIVVRAIKDPAASSGAWGLRGSCLLSALFLFSASFSGILTLGREAVSRYQLYGASQVALAEYVAENTPADAVFLTNTRHNNEIASLTGRNIVCGADTFLYYHGLDTTERKADLHAMYEAPLEHMDLFEKYNVNYVVISAFERSSYKVDETAFSDNFTEIFSYGSVTLYQVR